MDLSTVSQSVFSVYSHWIPNDIFQNTRREEKYRKPMFCSINWLSIQLNWILTDLSIPVFVLNWILRKWLEQENSWSQLKAQPNEKLELKNVFLIEIQTDISHNETTFPALKKLVEFYMFFIFIFFFPTNNYLENCYVCEKTLILNEKFINYGKNVNFFSNVYFFDTIFFFLCGLWMECNEKYILLQTIDT